MSSPFCWENKVLVAKCCKVNWLASSVRLWRRKEKRRRRKARGKRRRRRRRAIREIPTLVLLPSTSSVEGGEEKRPYVLACVCRCATPPREDREGAGLFLAQGPLSFLYVQDRKLQITNENHLLNKECPKNSFPFNGSFAMAYFQLVYLYNFVCLSSPWDGKTPYDAEEKKAFCSPTHLLSSLLVMRKKRPAAARRYVYTGGGGQKVSRKAKIRQLWNLSPPEQNNGWNIDSFHMEAWGKVLQSKIVPPVERVWFKRRYRQKRHLCGGYLPKIAKISKKRLKMSWEVFLGAPGGFQVYLVPPVCH